jgi:hypothetical protein
MSRETEAIERLRKHRRGETPYEGWHEVGILRDCNDIVDAYLAEHPADEDELITPEWLESMDFKNNMAYLADDQRTLLQLTERHNGFGAIVWQQPDRQMVSVTIVLPGVLVKTRGELRALLRGLGVEPKQ